MCGQQLLLCLLSKRPPSCALWASLVVLVRSLQHLASIVDARRVPDTAGEDGTPFLILVRLTHPLTLRISPLQSCMRVCGRRLS